jgi:glycine cleavage system H protein
MANMRYTNDHEWIRVDGNIGTIGITAYAQSQLGDVVFVDLPEIGKHVGKGAEAAVVESVKAASEVYAPMTGEVIEINAALEAGPATVNQDAEGNGWFLKLKLSNLAEYDELMTEEQYKSYLETIS